MTYGGVSFWEDVPAMDVRKHIVRLPLVRGEDHQSVMRISNLAELAARGRKERTRWR